MAPVRPAMASARSVPRFTRGHHAGMGHQIEAAVLRVGVAGNMSGVGARLSMPVPRWWTYGHEKGAPQRP
jgi:hypothetical protein